MKALVFRGPHDLAVQDRADPVAGDGEVLLRVLATGICGSDVHGYTGENGRRRPGQVMGHETVARVAALGSGVAGPAVGTLATVNPVIGCGHCPACAARQEQRCPTRRVIGVDPTISSAFADLMVVPAANVVPLPDGLPAEVGALVEPLSVGYHAALRGGVSPDSAALVLGGGPIGQSVALAARRLGARVVVSELSPLRTGLLRRLGFDVVDPSQDADAFAAEVQELLGRRPDIVLDAVGVSATLGQALTVSAVGAVVVLVGMNAPDVQLSAYRVSTEERSVIGSFCYGSAEFAQTAQWAAEHAGELTALVEGIVDMDGGPAAFEDIATGRSSASKVLVATADGPAPR